MNKQEAKFQTLFSHWLKWRLLPSMDGGFAFELKHTRGASSLPFSDLQPHQANSLLAAATTGIVYKISDESRSYKPFDCFALKKCPAYVVIKYPKFFVMIPIKTFLQEQKRSKSKSLTGERAKEIATITVSDSPKRAA